MSDKWHATLQQLMNRVSNLTACIQNIIIEVDKVSKENEALTQKFDNMQRKYVEVQKELDDKKKAYDTVSLIKAQFQVDDAKQLNEVAAKMKRIKELEALLKKAEKDKLTLHNQNSRAVESYKKRAQEAETKSLKLQQKVADLTQKTITLTNQLESNEKLYTDQEAAHQRVVQELNDWKSDIRPWSMQLNCCAKE